MKGPSLDYSLLMLLALIWGSSFMMIKVSVSSISPITVSAGRLSVAAIIMLGLLWVSRQKLPLHRQALKLYLFVGFFGNALPFILISWGEIQIDSSLAAILMGTMPITTFVLAHITLPNEPITRRRAIGIVLGFLGIIVLVGLPALSTFGASPVAQLAVLGGAVSYSIATIFVCRQSQFSGTKMATGVLLAGALYSLILMFLFESPLELKPKIDSLIAVVLLGIFPTALATIFYFRVLKNLGATTFSQINYLVPIFGSIFGVIALNEEIKVSMMVALALVLSGIWLIRIKTVKYG